MRLQTAGCGHCVTAGLGLPCRQMAGRGPTLGQHCPATVVMDGKEITPNRKNTRSVINRDKQNLKMLKVVV